MANKWTKQLRAYDDAVDYDYDSFAPENCQYTPSPYFNWTFANKAHGVPSNASILFFSEPKAGKSLSCYAMILELQRRNAEAHSLYFNSELRGQLQHNIFPAIDKERCTIYDTNDPVAIFDRLETDVRAMVQDGFPLKQIFIDSLTNIIGVKRKATESVEDHLMGDKAATVQNGLEKLIPFCKQNKILLVCTAQMRANFEGGPHGPKTKMAGAWAMKHAFEYYISLKRAGDADDKKDLEGKTFEEEDIKDARGNKLLLAHKIYAKMEASSIGQAGRAGIFTMDYKNGIINQHEEIFFLGKNTGIISLEGKTYKFGSQKWVGKGECAEAIRDNPKLAEEILNEVKKLDQDKV